MSMDLYSDDIEVLANNQWHVASATLWRRRERRSADDFGVRSTVAGPESWGGCITLEGASAAQAIAHDEERRLRLPNGEERTFSVSACFANAMNIIGNGTVPFD